MAARKSGLGRGLDALLPQDRPISGYAEIPTEAVAPNPKQPRSEFDAESMDALAASIEAIGLLQPIVVRKEADGYVLVAGERRLRAVKQVGLQSISAVIRDDADDEANLTEALVENLQREDLSILEEAAAFQELLEEYGMTHDGQAMLVQGELTAGHARALLGSEDEAYAVHIAQRAVAEGWTVRRVEEAIRLRATQGQTSSARPKSVRPAAIIELEERLQDRLGTTVRIDYRGRGGKIMIRYSSSEDLERIYRHLFRPGSE